MSSVTDIARRRADRLRVMNAIYEAAEGSRMSHVSGGWLLEHLGLSDEELGANTAEFRARITEETQAERAEVETARQELRELHQDEEEDGKGHESAREAIVEGSSGHVVSAGDDRAMAERITAMLDKSDLSLMGEEGLRVVQERFSLAAQLARTEELYDRLLIATR